MTVRAVEGKNPYTGGTAIEITEDKVINLLLREMNNLLQVNGNNELYCDLQLNDELMPTDDFPVGVTTGRIIEDNGWDRAGTILCAKTTSGDNIKLVYTDAGEIWVDNGTGTFKRMYLASEVDELLVELKQELEQEFEEFVDTKTFFWTGNPSRDEVLEVWDWLQDRNNAIIAYRTQAGQPYKEYMMTQFAEGSGSMLGFAEFHCSTNLDTKLNYSGTYSQSAIPHINISEDGNCSFSNLTGSLNYLATDVDYQTPYTPQYDGSPATKKYVDDKSVVVGSTAPSNATVGTLWFDNTAPALRIYDGTQWIEVMLNYNPPV